MGAGSHTLRQHAALTSATGLLVLLASQPHTSGNNLERCWRTLANKEPFLDFKR